MKLRVGLLILAACWLSSCRTSNEVVDSEVNQPGSPEDAEVAGFYILNEGPMGANKASLDFYDYATGTYQRDIYPERNPTEVKELGDTGNDILIYGSKMYAVINGSNKIEVMDAQTAKSLGSIAVENGRKLVAANGNVYVSSFAGPIMMDDDAPLGKVLEIDTLSLKVKREVVVGYQPEGLTVVGQKLFVANSGGYKYPTYDNTISVVDLPSFKETTKWEVAINMSSMASDEAGNIYVNSLGNYGDIPAKLFVVDSSNGTIKKEIDRPASGFALSKDKLYFYASLYSSETGGFENSFGVIDLKDGKYTESDFGPGELKSQVMSPYAMAVNPKNGDVILGDAGDFMASGTVYLLDKDGKLKWKNQAGIVPGHFTFLMKK